MEVDAWTGFTRHFTHVKTGESAADRALLLAVILADAINLGLAKMADSCPGITYAKLSWLQAWHIREETYSAALADLGNAQFVHPFAAHWSDGSTSSSDGQRFRSAARAHAMGNVNPKYGSEPGVQFYTHISDQYAPFHTKVINVGVRDATYVLDGLLYHESDLRIEEHYTDTSSAARSTPSAFAPSGTKRCARAVQALADGGQAVDETLLRHLSPLGWEHINLTGDYVWRHNKRAEKGDFRPLRRALNR